MNLNLARNFSFAACLLLAAPLLAQSEAKSEAQSEGEETVAPAAEAAKQTASPGAQLSTWYQRAAQAFESGDNEAWVRALEQLHRLRPFNYDFMRQMVMGYAMTGKTSKAFNMMLQMQQQGLAVDWDEVDEVESLRQYPLYGHLRDLMQTAGEPSGQVSAAFEIDADYPMPEAVAHDPETGRTFVGTVRDGLILVRNQEDGELTRFADPEDTPGLMAVFDLLVDAARGHLWVATGGTGQFRDARDSNVGRTALIKLDLATGEKLGEYRVLPDGQAHLLGAMALASDGTIYASDSAAPMIYRLQPDDERPQPLVGNPVFTGLRGIALSEDESRLYVADYDLGVFFFELGDQPKGFALGIPETLNLGGIDGLYHWNDHLVAIQNGITPQRVLRLELDDSGTRVAKIGILAKALPEFDDPTFGTVTGDDLVFLGGSHWQRVGPNGRPVDPPLPDVPVLRVSIEEAMNTVAGEEMLDQFKRSGAASTPQG